ncbi:MAG: hypothetical protein WCE79_23805 [Xanthobacteraceae bacterium]
MRNSFVRSISLSAAVGAFLAAGIVAENPAPSVYPTAITGKAGDGERITLAQVGCSSRVCGR